MLWTMNISARFLFLAPVVLWSLLTIIIWKYHRSTIVAFVPLHRIPWVSEYADVKPEEKPRLLLSNGHWTSAPARANDTLVWGRETPNHDCLGPSVLTNGHVRSQDVDAWQWVLEDGSSLVDFDIEKFVIRGLQSRIGYVLIGGELNLYGRVFSIFMPTRP